MSNTKQGTRRGGPFGHGPGHGPGGHMGSGEKAKDFKGTMGKLFQYLGKYRIAVLLVVIFAIGSAAFSIIGPKIMGSATTEIFNGLMGKISGDGSTGIDFGKIGEILIKLLVLYIVSSLFAFIQGYIMTGVSQKVSYNLRQSISLKINRMPMKYFETRTHGEVLSRVTNDVDTLSQSLNQSMTQVITSITTVIGVLVMMFSISWVMTLVSLLILPVSMLLISLIVKRSQKYFRSQQEYLGHVNGEVEEVYGGHNIVRAFNGEKDVTDEFNQLNDTLYSSAWKSQFLSGMMQPLMMFIGNLGYVMVSILGGWLVIKNSIEVGDIQSFIQYVRMFNQPIAQVAQVANLLQSTAAAAERVFEFLDEEEEDQTAENAVSIEGLTGAVEFKNVQFGYTPEKTIIHNFTASVKPGQKVAIVGPTGAGKTTLVNLLMRFYEITSGDILVDGVSIKDMSRQELRDIFGMILQETWVINGTLRENIVYNLKNVDENRLREILEETNLSHYVSTLPQGLDTEIQKESALSAGQKQLVTIARAMTENAPMLILDEATSNVDTRTEILIQKAMDSLTSGRTSFVIAHRLSTIKNADLIFVMKDGNIVETGNHDSLMELGGLYSEIYNSQFN